MLIKIVSFIASLILLLTGGMNVPLPEKSNGIYEDEPVLSDIRYADEIKGADGIRFFIERPVSEKLNVINAEEFGLSAENADNFSAFQSILSYLRENPGTKLKINEGTYYFTSHGTLTFNGCRDIYVDAGGARFVFSTTDYNISVTGSECIEINGLTFDWAHEKLPLASVVTVKNADEKNRTLELEFKDKKNAREDIALEAITQCDSETLTFGANKSSKEVYLYQDETAIESVEKISEDTLKITHNGCMGNFSDGETYILRHFVYGGTAFQITGESRDITLSNINIYGSSGMALIAEGNSSHFQLIDSYIGVEKGYEDERFVSCTADAIHIVNTKGCFNISGCDISALGDDCINVHDGLGYITEVRGKTITVTASAMLLRSGDTLKFKNGEFRDVDFSARIVSVKNLEGNTREITLDKNAPINIEGYIVYNADCDSGNYVIRENFFHENRARGLLLQSSNGLCENNTFYRTMGQAIKIIMDIIPALWQEGTGVNNLIVRNNTFTDCNYSDWGTVIELGSNIDGREANSYIFTDIVIENNIFDGMPSKLLIANNVNGLDFIGNTVNAGDTFSGDSSQGKLYFKEYCANISYRNNTFENLNCFSLSPIVDADDIKLWAEINSRK